MPTMPIATSWSAIALISSSCRPQNSAICRKVSVVLSTSQTAVALGIRGRSEEHTSELQSLMRISYAVFCLKKKTYQNTRHTHTLNPQKHNNHMTHTRNTNKNHYTNT